MVKLVLFFTRGVSLSTWDQIGMFDREVALYRRLQECGVQVSFLTYGDASDLQYSLRLPGIRILCNRWGLPPRCYERWLAWLHAPYLIQGDVFKTNQINGAELAQRAARFWRKPLIARGGYLFYENTGRVLGFDTAAAAHARQVEQCVYTAAKRIVVTTAEMKQTITDRYNLAPEKVTVIPNYVDTDLFQPDEEKHHKQGQLCFVGRLEPEKNTFALLEAIRDLPVELVMIGNGSLHSGLIKKAQAENLPVHFLGNLPNAELPKHLNTAEIFILPSHYEGQPKTLIEAMSCGLAVIGADSPGIREVLRHGETGWLCGTDPQSIREAIQHLLQNPSLRATLGKNARIFVEQNFALDRIVETEYSLLKEIKNGAIVESNN